MKNIYKKVTNGRNNNPRKTERCTTTHSRDFHFIDETNLNLNTWAWECWHCPTVMRWTGFCYWIFPAFAYFWITRAKRQSTIFFWLAYNIRTTKLRTAMVRFKANNCIRWLQFPQMRTKLTWNQRLLSLFQSVRPVRQLLWCLTHKLNVLRNENATAPVFIPLYLVLFWFQSIHQAKDDNDRQCWSSYVMRTFYWKWHLAYQNTWLQWHWVYAEWYQQRWTQNCDVTEIFRIELFRFFRTDKQDH